MYRPLQPSNLIKTLAIIKKKGREDLAESFFHFTVESLTGERAAARAARRKR